MRESVVSEEAIEDVRVIRQDLWRLQKLLTDLPDDMLEDSRDCSSPELDRSTCSHQGDDNRTRHAWNVPQWEDRRPSHEGRYEEDGQGSYNEGSYRSHTSQTNSHPYHLQAGSEHLHPGWDQQTSGNYQYQNGDYAGTDESRGTDFSAADGDDQDAYPHDALRNGAGYHEEEAQSNGLNYGAHASAKKQLQCVAGNRPADHYKASYHPHQPSNQPKMFNPQAANHNGHFDQLQRDFLDSTQKTSDGQQLAQLHILNRAQSRQIEELEQKLEDCRRNMRYLEHQFAIVKDERDGLAMSLKESGALVEEGKEKEAQLQARIRSLEKQTQALAEREQACVKQQRAAEVAMDGMQQQMMELCRSETLTRAREQHDRDMTALREQHEAKLLALQQKLDDQSQSLEEQAEAGQRLLDQVRQLERQREEDQMDRASVINTLTQRLEESQQQCAKLLHTGSVQEMSQLQMKLQQALSARSISEDINKAMQEDLTELKEQINLYESAVKHGALSIESNGDWENQLSESCIDLGIKKSKWRNGRIHSTPHIADVGDSGPLKDDVVRELKSELQRCLSHLKSKRLKISELQEELKSSQTKTERLQTQLDQAEKTARDSKVRESSLEKHLESSGLAAAPQKELVKLQEERQVLQDRVEALEKRNQELKQSEEKVKAANFELCTKMREMIQELDQEKQEAAERYERTQQQYRDDVVNRVRAELAEEHTAHVEQLISQHQQQIQQLESKLSDLSQEMLAVQECYISVCKEKDKLEENLQREIDEERRLGEDELKRREESDCALERLKSDLESQHQEDVTRLKAQWKTETQAEVEPLVQKQLESTRQNWQRERETLEKCWAQKLQRAQEEIVKLKKADACEGGCQTSFLETTTPMISPDELEIRLSDQRETLQQEAATAQARALDEAVKRARRELQQKHTDGIALKVEGAISRARSRWLQDLTSLPEYKSSLQTEREEWERQQEKRVQEQVSAAVKNVEDEWQEKLCTKCTELDECNRRNRELLEEVLILGTLQESSGQEQAALIKAEMAAARDVWMRDKQEEMSRLRAELQKEHKHKLQVALVQNLTLRNVELQEALREKEQDWRSRQEIRLQEETRRVQEEVLSDLKVVLLEGLERRNSEQTSSSVTGTIRSRLWQICRETLSQTVHQAKQEWKKSSDDKLRCVLKETQERHEAEIASLMARWKLGPCTSAECAETLAKLQKRNQDLQRHLQKACRHLQRATREHKSTLQKIKAEHEEALQKQQESHNRALGELQQASDAEAQSSAVNRRNLQAGLEEMKEQYTQAVEKIKGDMLRYLQETKERSADLIRAEVMRERQDTARKMRRYYLTCVQELLEDEGHTTGAEKKIISAASKLASMAKVLETPVPKRKLLKTQNSQGESAKSDGNTTASPAEVLGAASHGAEVHVRRKDQKIYNLTETIYTAKQKSVKAKYKDFEPDFLKSGMLYDSKDPGMTPQIPHASQKRTQSGLGICSNVTDDSIFQNNDRTTNVTLRKHSREKFMEGFLIEEPPVRDDGQSDWSLTSNGCNIVNNVHLTSSYPEPGKPFLINGPLLGGLNLGSSIGEHSDITLYKEIVPPFYSKVGDGRANKHREPIPGSEGDDVLKSCPMSLFSELKVRQHDSGFDSPLARHQK
ncbi:centrosomal protein of 152 kDa isoform X2 [Triplophysa rosa]|uniref:centrosomal protein of 152 kDa isoform X2 n=1 Tax=Triplophysa rosa TaxID=992332 RepID=UPI0025460DA4|nr:centrosomal protein of 152 kDa isoform X2 [Triplophysa rosa]